MIAEIRGIILAKLALSIESLAPDIIRVKPFLLAKSHNRSRQCSVGLRDSQSETDLRRSLYEVE